MAQERDAGECGASIADRRHAIDPLNKMTSEYLEKEEIREDVHYLISRLGEDD